MSDEELLNYYESGVRGKLYRDELKDKLSKYYANIGSNSKNN
jgi:hypothetical protein